MHMHALWILAASIALAAPLVHAAEPSPSPKPAKAAAAADDISAPARGGAKPDSAKAAANASPKGSKLLWDYWYTVTTGKSIPYEIYNDRVEIREGKVVYQNHAWKREEGYVNEEQLGAFAKNDEELTPLFFNFHSTYRASEKTIDANVTEEPARQLVVRIRKGGEELPLVKKMLPRKTFFSSLFPVWLGNRLSTFKTGSPYSFQTILEDNLEAGFMTIDGTLRPAKPDETAGKTHSTRLDIEYANVKSTWWVEASGAPVRIEFPGQVVQRVSSKEEAQKFFGKTR